ncbi:pirin family protein [Ilumatobacter sp.]|uniref:pirin family protein n=1 Tax=Ilumatobacter sp. TaxID=1967498 RepID=UPI003C43B19A
MTSTSTPTPTTDRDTLRPVAGVVGNGRSHWVGDGFRVEGMFGPHDELARLVDPFLLLDYHAPYEYGPTDTPRGVGVHPHRGFETVTLAFDGSVAHHDSTGAGGVIRPGDVQWMTASSGILHKEYHDADWARSGGRFHMVQLWVNLPAASKMDAPHYQPLTAEQIGQVELEDHGGSVRVVAGDFDGNSGAATTYTPINLWDVELNAGSRISPSVPSDHNVAVLALDGNLTVNGADVPSGRLAILDSSGPGRDGVEVATVAGGRALVMTGRPIDEPVAAYGPFVMNTRQQIAEAYDDFQAGRFGHLDG